MPGKVRKFTPEFKEQAVKMVVRSSPPRTIAGVARELNINDTTLGFWVKAYRKKLAGQPLGDMLRRVVELVQAAERHAEREVCFRVIGPHREARAQRIDGTPRVTRIEQGGTEEEL